MAEESDKALFYDFLNRLYDKIRDLETYIKMLEMIESCLKRANWESPETQQFVKKFKEHCRRKFQYEPDEYNIRELIESKNNLYQHLHFLKDVLRKNKDFQNFLSKWQSAGKKIIDLIPLVEDFKNAKNTNLSQADADQIISAFAEGKNAMMRLMNYLSELKIHHGHIFIGKILDCYIDFFKSMDGFFNRIEKYARKINEEAKGLDDNLNNILRRKYDVNDEIKRTL